LIFNCSPPPSFKAKKNEKKASPLIHSTPV
jgi:hypothetical protein